MLVYSQLQRDEVAAALTSGTTMTLGDHPCQQLTTGSVAPVDLGVHQSGCLTGEAVPPKIRRRIAPGCQLCFQRRGTTTAPRHALGGPARPSPLTNRITSQRLGATSTICRTGPKLLLRACGVYRTPGRKDDGNRPPLCRTTLVLAFAQSTKRALLVTCFVLIYVTSKGLAPPLLHNRTSHPRCAHQILRRKHHTRSQPTRHAPRGTPCTLAQPGNLIAFPRIAAHQRCPSLTLRTPRPRPHAPCTTIHSQSKIPCTDPTHVQPPPTVLHSTRRQRPGLSPDAVPPPPYS